MLQYLTLVISVMKTKVVPRAIKAVLLSKGMCHFIMFYLATSLCALVFGRLVLERTGVVILEDWGKCSQYESVIEK